MTERHEKSVSLGLSKRVVGPLLEYLKPVNGGRNGGSYADITATTESGHTVRVNTVDTYKDGVTMNKREADNASRIRRQAPEDHLVTIPKPVK